MNLKLVDLDDYLLFLMSVEDYMKEDDKIKDDRAEDNSE